MKVMTVFGTRPEIIRLSLIVGKLDRLCEHVVVNTGQNFAPSLNDAFVRELGMRPANHSLGIRGDTAFDQIGKILTGCEDVIVRERPDRLLILGDTNSGLSAIVAKRLGIPVFHMEAGNRCFDDRVPEEVNRRLIDHSSDVLMPYTERSRANLLREGISGQRIHVTGNPIHEVISHYGDAIDRSDILGRLQLEPSGYILVTAHRAENVDIPQRLRDLTSGLERIAARFEWPVIVSTHPRTRAALSASRIAAEGRVRFLEPFGFFDFITLEKNARAVLSDSGTVQEECAIFKVPNVTLRDVTERPETVECGSNMIAGVDPDAMLQAVTLVLSQPAGWLPPPEYLVPNVSDIVVRIVLGHHSHLRDR
jgi:UDP-N-acetylglucosamine 2-epimerase (non-hydrolysing)